MMIGQKLLYYRERMELSQNDIALQLHCDRPTYSYYELDESLPDLDQLWKISGSSCRGAGGGCIPQTSAIQLQVGPGFVRARCRRECTN